MCTGCNKFCVFTHCVYRECAELIEARPASLHASYCVWYCVSLKGDTVPLVSTRGQNVSCGSARAHQVSFSKPWSVSWPSHSKNIYKIPKEWLFWKFTLGKHYKSIQAENGLKKKKKSNCSHGLLQVQRLPLSCSESWRNKDTGSSFISLFMILL